MVQGLDEVNTSATPGPRRLTSLRAAVARLFVAAFLPLLLTGTAFLVFEWYQQQTQAVERLQRQARNLRLSIERELVLDQAVLQALAASQDFDRQDWVTLHQVARKVSDVRTGSWVVVINRDGQNVLNSNVPLGTPLPNVRLALAQRREVEWNGRKLPLPEWRLFEEPLRTGGPSFSGLVYGPVSKRPVVAVNAPVIRGGVPQYVVGMAYGADFFVNLLKVQSAADGFVRVILDQDGLIVARSSGAEEFIGLRRTVPVDPATGRPVPEGTGEAVNLDGVPVFFAHSRVDINGWTVGVAVPKAQVLEPARIALSLWFGALLLAGSIGGAWAFGLWRRLTVPLAALASRARAPELQGPDIPPSNIAEVETLREALESASRTAAERRAAERELVLAEERFRAVVESSLIAKLMVDERGAITMVNRRVEEYFGYPRSELLGQPVHMLVPKALREGHVDHIAQYFAAPSARPMGLRRDLYGKRKDGTEFPLEVGLVPLTVRDDRFVLASIVDISERKRAEDDLRRSNKDLEQFAYIASHDLQEPLRMVASFTELLAKRYQGQLDERADKYIFYAVDGAKRMQGLITDLLAFSRAGSSSRELAPVDAAAAMATVLRMMRPTIESAGADVIVEPLPTVMSDDAQLQQVFQNLVGNALKFRGEAPPVVRVSAQRVDSMWRFSVQDNGIGFESEYAERIFLMFQRLHERGRFDGSGIGLAIVKRIVERHGGRVWAESQLGVGSSFYFTLKAPPEVS